MDDSDIASESSASIVIVEDNIHNLQVLARIVKQIQAVPRAHTNSSEAWEDIVNMPPVLILLDVELPGESGFELAQRLQNNPTLCKIPILFISARDGAQDRLKAFSLGAADYIAKPIEPQEVVARIQVQLTNSQLLHALEQANRDLDERVRQRTQHLEEARQEIEALKDALERDNQDLRKRISAVNKTQREQLIGNGPAMSKLRQQIETIAPLDTTALILGETGTGKELVARAIHKASARRDGPLITVNCAAIPKDLFESEFFGHAKGAFTGALQARAGRFEQANGGTLFLDEIGEIPFEQQAKLLRALQERVVERVGEQKMRSVDFRLIAATNRDIETAVFEGTFREDLFFRLNVYPIKLLPLHQRLEDIPEFVYAFVQRTARRFGIDCPQLDPGVISRFQDYDWPGNIRELENIVERLVIDHHTGSESIFPWEVLRTTYKSKPAHEVPPATNPTVLLDDSILTEEDIQRINQQNTLKALKASRWKIYGTEGAAAQLGIKPATLCARMKNWGLERPV